MSNTRIVKGVRILTPTLFFIQIMIGAVGGATFGVLFAFCAWLTEPGPELTTGILQTWWFFAILGAIGQPVAFKYDSYEGLRNLRQHYSKSFKS